MTEVLHGVEQQAAGRKAARRPKREKSLQKDAATLALVEECPRIEDKRGCLEKVARNDEVVIQCVRLSPLETDPSLSSRNE